MVSAAAAFKPMESLGNDLKSARTKRNISLETIADETRINLSYLRLLEEGRYGDLPGGMYNRAFLRTYCEYLGLDAKSFLQRYEDETASSSEKTPKSRASTFQPLSYPQPHPFVIWSVLLGLTIAGLYLSRHWITSVFSPYFSGPPPVNVETRHEATPPISPPPSTAPQPNPGPGALTVPQTGDTTARPTSPGQFAASNSPAASILLPSGSTASSTAAKPTGQPQPPKEIQIRIHAVQECWTSVTSDGKRIFVKMLNPGDDQSFDAAERLIIVLGNAAGVHLTINGKPAKQLGKSGEAVKVSIDKQSIPDLVEKPPAEN